MPKNKQQDPDNTSSFAEHYLKVGTVFRPPTREFIITLSDGSVISLPAKVMKKLKQEYSL